MIGLLDLAFFFFFVNLNFTSPFFHIWIPISLGLFALRITRWRFRTAHNKV